MSARAVGFIALVCLSLHAAADDRLEGLAALIQEGKAPVARERLLAAQTAYHAEHDARGESRALILLGFANEVLGDERAARENMEQAAAMLSASDEPIGAWMALLFLAGVDSEREHWDEAVKHFSAALEVLRTAAARPAVSLAPIADLASLFGHSSELFELLVKLMPPGSGNKLTLLFEGITRDAFSQALVEMGEFEQAEHELNRAAEISLRSFGMFDSSIAKHRGDLERMRGNFDEARTQYQNALGDSSFLPLPVTWSEAERLKIMSHLEDVELLSGHVDAALAWNGKALQFVRERGQRTREASILQNRGALLMQAGRIADALAVMEQAESVAESAWETGLQASILTDIGSLQMFQGNYGSAAATLEKALAIYPLANDLRGESHAWAMLTEVYVSLAAHQDAGEFLDKACALATRTDYPPAVMLVDALASMRATMSAPFEITAVRNALAQALELLNTLGPGTDALPVFQELKIIFDAGERFARGDLEAARTSFRKLLETSFNRDIRAAALAGLGSILVKEGKPREAIAWFRQAADSIEDTLPDIQDDTLVARYFGAERHHFFDATIELMLREGLVEDAFDYSERARARAFLRTIGNHRIAPRTGSGAELVREAEILRTRIAEWNRNGAPSRSELQSARRRYATLLTRLKTTNPEYASLANVEPLRAVAIRGELPADTTLISYFLTAEGTHAFVVDRERVQHVRLPLDAAALRRAVCWAEQFHPERPRGARPLPLLRGRCADRATSAEVFDWLIAPLRQSIRNRRLTIVPYGALHYIPFAALYDSRRKQYLIEKYPITYAPSASALRFLRSKQSPVTGRAVVLGDPENRSGDLPGAKQEALAVAEELGTTALLAKDAKESVLFTIAGSADIVHIGAHAEFDPVNPLFSRIALAGGNGRDGYLEVHEILGELDLTGVNLVVLSACETAAGENSGGDDIVGLTQAVLYAGSPAVISTLWKIGDDPAAVLMEDFYRRLAHGAAAADALRDAQVALLRNATFADPKNWAAFTLTGQPDVRWNH